jgi:glutathione S-transferase
MLVVYGDLLSQPTRAVLLLCKLAGIPHQFQLIRVAKGEQKKPDYLAINPDGRIPAIKDGDFTLSESHAILTYLCTSRGVADHWYPKDVAQRAVVDRYLHWHHSNLRHAHLWVWELKWAPLFGLKQRPYVLEESPIVLKRALNLMEKWLTASPYIAGAEASIADISALCELTQLELIPYDFSAYPKLQAWYQRLRSLPETREVHAMLDKSVAKYQPKL